MLIKSLKKELEEAKDKMIKSKNADFDFKSLGSVIPGYAEWEKAVEEYNELFPFRTISTENRDIKSE